jgi:hypothetical protein
MNEVVESLIEIRDELTETLKRLGERAQSAAMVHEMREAIIRFLIAAGTEQWVTSRVVALLGELRGVFVVNLRVLSDTFGLEVRGALGDAITER